jgi:acyl-CoA synthetase (AMP-forming)/AMP-acid ligase II
MRTGDLGLLVDGELFITGRRKEVIIVRGRKHFPTDIEDTIEKTHWGTSHYRAGGTAAFATIVDGEERLCVAVEVERRRRDRRANQQPAEERRRGSDRRARPFNYKPNADDSTLDATEVVRAIRRAIANAHGVEPWAVVLLRPGAIPKTSSGKKQRVLCKKRYLGDPPPRDVLHAWRASDIIVGSPSKKIRIA